MVKNQSRQKAYDLIEKIVIVDSSDNELTYKQLENPKKEDDVADLSSVVKLLTATQRNIEVSDVSVFGLNVIQSFELMFFSKLFVYHIRTIEDYYWKIQIAE